MDISNNLLLYGPPGTGKTYNTVNYAVAIVEDRPYETVVEEGYDLALEKYDRYTKMGRIAFMTFHQSLSYDDFIEGIRPVITADDQLIYKATPGVFYQFCVGAEHPQLLSTSCLEEFPGLNENASVWGVDLTEFVREILETTDYDVGDDMLDPQAREGDVVVSVLPGGKVHALGIVKQALSESGKGIITWKIIYSVPDANTCPIGLNPEKARAFLSRFRGGECPTDKGNCVFIIDEINRGNISRIFGELITLLESSRRKGLPECLEVYLPQMKVMFSVPQNVFVLGTMNTADKSLTALDTALRRRFEFIEKMPDPDVLKGRRVADVDLSKLLAVINNRIELLYDREHTMGHAYFISVKTMDDLAQCFIKKVIPLLQEYFFDDYEKMCWVLGKNSDPHQCSFITLRPRNKFQNAFNLPDVFDIQTDYRVFMNPESYIQIYRGADI